MTDGAATGTGTGTGTAIEGTTERDGVRLAYAVHGSGPATVVLLPTWSILPSRFWKAQVPYLSRHYRVLTFDGRGSGRSARPSGAAAYADTEYAADTVAVMDAAGVGRAVLVGLSRGATWAVHVAAGHPERVSGMVAIAPYCGFPTVHPRGDEQPWDEEPETWAGWATYNKHVWLGGGYKDFLSFFFGEVFSEPHSTKQVEDCVAWGLEVSPQTLVDTEAGSRGQDGAVRQPVEPLCPRVRCPVLVLHGTDDRVVPLSSSTRLAELTGGDLVLLEGSGHCPTARDPVVVNEQIRRFVDRVHPAAHRTTNWTWTKALRRPRRVLYLSSPIGLGHGRRDVAIASELRRLRPGLQIDWLTQHPVTRMLEQAGERVHPASAALRSESGHIEAECGEHDLNAFQAIRSMDEILVGNFMVFADLVRDEQYDLVVGDEAWDVDHFLHEDPRLKRSPYAWLTDFVGWLPMPEGGAAEVALTTDYNAEMLEQRERLRHVRDRSVFVGRECDVIDGSFGPGLPGIRAWTAANFDFAGYVTGFAPTDPEDRLRLREELGHRPDERVCVVTVGGSAVGSALLRRVLDAVPVVRRAVPDLHFLVVTGPRIDPATLPCPDGVDLRGWVPDLVRHLAACDVAVVQGGLTTCMELTANRRPFVYVPLRRHFEQNLHVRHRLDAYRAGTCLPYDVAADPDALAAAVVAELGRTVDYAPVESDGAARAASLLAALL